jgi:CheY-like chemotaxis protein
MTPAPLRLLAVEDQPANVALLRAVLSRAAEPELRTAEMAVAGSLAEARAALRGAGDVDVVLLDVRLPDGSGLELLPSIAEREPRPGVVVLTANALPGDAEAARAAGADAFVAKPYEPRMLTTTILELASTLDGRAGQR